MSTARQQMTSVSVLHLPAPLGAHVERQIARQQELNDQLAAMERQLGGAPLSVAWTAKWKAAVAELTGINDLIELLQVPMVRFVAFDQAMVRRQRLEQSSRAAAQARRLAAARLN